MTKKKIGVLNFQYSTHNYGAVLQAAALEYILKAEGHDVEHINFIPSFRKRSLKGIVKKVLLSLGIFKFKQKAKPGNSEAFERFRTQFLTRSSKIITPEQFSELANKYDLVVVGSDQVWRPRMAADPAAFFLLYVPDGVERVSYAASFGAREWESEADASITSLAKTELTKFKAVSCRETSGVEICKSVFGVDAVHVLDPLLQVSDSFIDKVLNVANPSNKKLVYYKLDYDEEFIASLKEIEQQKGIGAHNLYRKNGELNDYEEVSQWIRNIYDSEIVVSDSFHCICLALRFGKRVIYCPNPKRGQARLDDLFAYLDIETIIMSKATTKGLFELKCKGNLIDTLNRLRNSSSRFIDFAIN